MIYVIIVYTQRNLHLIAYVDLGGYNLQSRAANLGSGYSRDETLLQATCCKHDMSDKHISGSLKSSYV